MSRIRATVLGCFIRNGDEVLVMHGFDSAKNEVFFRFPGGGIEPGESGEAALHREMREELQQNIRIVRHLGFFENIFEYEGRPHHEIQQIFHAEFLDEAIYRREEFELFENYEGKINPRATWVAIADFRDGGKIIYPAGVLERLDGAVIAPHEPPPLAVPALISTKVAEQFLEARAEAGARKFLVDRLLDNATLLPAGKFEFSAEDVNRFLISPELSLAAGRDRYPETCHYHRIKTEIYIGGFRSLAIWKLGDLTTLTVRKDFEGVIVIPPGWCHLMRPKSQLLWTLQIPNPAGNDKDMVEVPPAIAEQLR